MPKQAVDAGVKDSVFELRSRMSRMMSIVNITSPNYQPVPEKSCLIEQEFISVYRFS